MARQARIARDLTHGFLAQNALSIPISLAEYHPAHARQGARREITATPCGDQRQTVHRKCLVVTNSPFFIGDANETEETLAEQCTSIFVRARRRRDAVGQ